MQVAQRGGSVDAILAEAPLAEFSEWFRAWLAHNWLIWEAFEREANMVWRAGRRHYSARTIGEVLRHQTVLRQTDEQFKLNDWAWPFCARLYLRLHPERTGFFDIRSRT